MRHLRTQALRRIRPHLGHSDVGSVQLNQGISSVSTCQILIILTSAAGISTLKYAQLRDVESIRAITCAYQTLDLAAEPMVRNYREELSSDPTIRSHLTANLLCLVELYSTIRYVAQAKYTTNSSRACPVWADFALYSTAEVPQMVESISKSMLKTRHRSATRRDCHYRDGQDRCVRQRAGGRLHQGCLRTRRMR